jgi:outer membrane protein OmpA-like peptidoglycan-associated protein
MINMKKQLFLIGLIFTMFVAYAHAQAVEPTDETQPTATAADSETETTDEFCPHRILMRVGGGYANNMYKELRKSDLVKTCSYTALIEVGYAYFFHRNIGIGLGVGLNNSSRIVRVDGTARYQEFYDPDYVPGENVPYNFLYTMHKFRQRHTVWAIDVPLTLQFEKKFGGRNGIYSHVGVKGYFPIASRLSFPGGTIYFPEIHDPALNVYYKELYVHMDGKEVKKAPAIAPKMRISVDVIGEFGGIFGIARNADLYIGAFASYGFLNILPKENIELMNLNTIDHKLAAVIDQYANPTKKWNLLNAGIKIGFHFLPCKSCGNDEYMRDAKRAYMKKMMAKKDEPIVITNTVTEYFYFVPTLSQELLDESANDPNKKKALLDLAQSLSLIKILFDLDKDIPKLTDRNRTDINKVVEILTAHQDLKVLVSGYTSPEGTKDHNKDLGHRRALAVRKIFLDRGISPEQITVQNFIAEDPQHKIDIPEKEWPEQRAVIFKIEKS